MNEKIRNLFVGVAVVLGLGLGSFFIWGGPGLGIFAAIAGAGIIGFIGGRAGKGSGGGGVHSATTATDEAIRKGFSDINKHIDSLQLELRDTNRRVRGMAEKFSGSTEQIVEGIRGGTIRYTDENGNPVYRSNGSGGYNDTDGSD